MDTDAKKTALRMIPYGLYVLTAKSGSQTAAATVNWVTQGSFDPPLVVVGVKKDSGTFAVVSESGSFALNVLGKGQNDAAFGFFKPVEPEGDKLGGLTFKEGTTGAPIFTETPAFIECKVTDTVDRGDHAIIVGEVIEAGVNKQPEGRADDATLWLKDLGEKMFYGG
jgi:flavin reductase (DIM6/NTAB) family NADH-FMN oxidoreductase RutF